MRSAEDAQRSVGFTAVADVDANCEHALEHLARRARVRYMHLSPAARDSAIALLDAVHEQLKPARSGP